MDWSSKISAYLNLGAKETTERGALLASIGESVQAAIEKRIGRTFEPAAYVDTVDGNGRRMLYLPHDPIIAVTAVTVDSTALDLTLFVVRDKAGLVLKDGAVWSEGVGNIVVTYTAGYELPPVDLVQAGVRWAAGIFRHRDRIGQASTGIAGQSTSFTEEMPAWMEKTIAAHIRWDRPC